MPEVTVAGVGIEVRNGATVFQAYELAGKVTPRFRHFCPMREAAE